MKLYCFDKTGTDLGLKEARDVLYDKVLFLTFGDIRPEIEKGSHGKPYFLKPYDGYHFNISHSGDIVVMAVGDSPVGVDVERIGRAKDYMKLARRFFYKHEYERVETAIQSEDEFYRVWTYREALSKLVGEGLSLYSRKDIRTDYDRQSVNLDEGHFVFYEYDYPGYRLTLCVPEGVERPKLTKVRL